MGWNSQQNVLRTKVILKSLVNIHPGTKLKKCLRAFTNFSWQDETWADFSTLKVLAGVLCTCAAVMTTETITEENVL